jgi:calcium-dependent protein kinase
VILYILLSGKPPFDGPNDQAICEEVKKGKFSMSEPLWDNISNDAKDLVKQMLTYDFNKRCTAKQALQHKWFEKAPEQELPPDLLKVALGNLLSFNATLKMQQATMSMMV